MIVRCEIAAGRPSRTLEQILADVLSLSECLSKRGHRECLAALEGRETALDGLQDLLCEYAAYDPKRRAWRRIVISVNDGHCRA